jgi:hypothetical protein
MSSLFMLNQITFYRLLRAFNHLRWSLVLRFSKRHLFFRFRLGSLSFRRLRTICELNLFHMNLLISSRLEISLICQVRILGSVNKKLIIPIEIALLRISILATFLVLYMLLVLFERNVNCATLWCLDQKQNIIFRWRVFICLFFIDIYEILFNNIAELIVRSILLKFFSQLFNLAKTGVELSLRFLTASFNLFLTIKFVLNLLYLFFKFFIFLIPF